MPNRATCCWAYAWRDSLLSKHSCEFYPILIGWHPFVALNLLQSQARNINDDSNLSLSKPFLHSTISEMVPKRRSHFWGGLPMLNPAGIRVPLSLDLPMCNTQQC